MKRFILIPILAFFAFLVPSTERAFAEGGIAWGPEGVPICEASETQWNMRMAPDGFGGAIIVWQDDRNMTTAPDIYAQRIDENGVAVAQWAPNGVPVCTETGDQLKPVVVGDGSGGAIIAWEDHRDPDPAIYAVRISSNGAPAWGGEVILRDVTLSEQHSPEIVEAEFSGVNGAVIVWKEKSGLDQYIYAQAIDETGAVRWVATGVQVSSGTDAKAKEYPKLIKSDSDNVIVTWQDQRNGNYDIYAHRIDITNGAVDPSWTVNGNPVTVAPGHQERPEIVSDGSGGAIIVWTDFRNGTLNSDIYAQWIDFNGEQVWTPDGVPICTEVGEQKRPVITEDLLYGTTMGAIIAWEDMRSGDFDIYAEKVFLEVDPEWTGGGIPIATDESAAGIASQVCPRLVSDNQGGGFGTWIENNRKIFVQRRGEYGQPMWSSYPGVLVCEGIYIEDSQIISDGSGGIIVAWVGEGAGGDFDIFAQRVIDDENIVISSFISGRVTLPDGERGIHGILVEALVEEEVISSVTTDTEGYYMLIGLDADTVYTVRATWSANDVVSSVSKDVSAPSNCFNFTLEIDYKLGTIAGNVSGVEGKYVASLSYKESKRISGSGIQKILSPGSGIAFVELEQRDKVIVRVPVEKEGNYSIPNLLPGRFIARAYNGTIYSNPRTVNLKEGETLKINFVFGIMPGETVFNYPNPAKKGSTTIRYYCGYSNPEAEIKIYNIAGELVRGVRDSEINRDGTDPRIYRFLWDCKNDSGKGVASGVYIYIVEVKEKSSGETKKVIKRMAVVR